MQIDLRFTTKVAVAFIGSFLKSIHLTCSQVNPLSTASPITTTSGLAEPEIISNDVALYIVMGSFIAFNATSDFLESFTWVLDQPNNMQNDEISLFDIAMHEMLHIWGLGHISNEDAIMYENTQAGDCIGNLTGYDILGLQKLYNESGCNPSTDDEIALTKDRLCVSYPNPFNPTITIVYKLTENIKEPNIDIFNIKGQFVKGFQLDEIEGENSIIWDGTDKNNKQVSSGIYFYRLENNGKISETRKMTLLR